jgi:hypothetical protein
MKISISTSFLLLFVFISSWTFGAAKDSVYKEYQYLILFKDKRFNYSDKSDPSAYLSEKALQRRKSMGIEIDSLDHPVSPVYIENLQREGLKVRYTTKWLNGAVVGVQEHENANILKLKFYVEKVVYLGFIERPFKEIKKTESFEELQSAMTNDEASFTFKNPVNEGYGESYAQNKMVGAVYMHKKGLTGKGVNIAVFDAGFFKANKLPTFEPLFKENRMIYSLDLVDDEADVFDDDDHGLHVLSCMAAKTVNRMIGTAPDANYFLFRTEMAAAEFLLEEINWIRAAELADSLGVDIINSSLGYTTFDDARMNHTHADLNGKTSYISRGASIAVSRGILVVNSAGNDGNDTWKKIGVPADAAQVIAVGAVDVAKSIAPFSSSGPTADFRIKPDVVAMGFAAVVASSYGTFYPGNGTSYSAPVLCGAIACMYESKLRMPPSWVVEAIRFSGDRSDRADTTYGFGVPDVFAAMTMAGMSEFFDYTSPNLIYNFPDTTDGNLILHLSTNLNLFAEIRVYMAKKFLFIPYKKTFYEEKKPKWPNGFCTFRIPLNKLTSRGELTAEIHLIDANGKKKLFLKEKFINYPNF